MIKALLSPQRVTTKPELFDKGLANNPTVGLQRAGGLLVKELANIT